MGKIKDFAIAIGCGVLMALTIILAFMGMQAIVIDTGRAIIR